MEKSKKTYKKCSRIVPNMKVEDHSSKSFWNYVFECLESDVAIPLHRRIEHLQDVFPENILKKVINILGCDKNQEDQSMLNASSSLETIMRRSVMLDVAIQKEHDPQINFRKTLTGPKSYAALGSNMYIRFLTVPETTAARWRPIPPRTFHGMNLNEKCEALTLAIASEFVEWLKGLGGDESTILDVPVILSLFEIGFNAHAADSLCVRIKELNAVSKAVANARNMPEASYTSKLYNQLYRDFSSVKKQEDMFAFGTMLPPEMRSAPQKDNIAVKWLQNTRVPERIATMATVWEGIENLRSTLGYCNWLLEHPEIQPPDYLVQAGLLDKVYEIREHRSASYHSEAGFTI
ncbi:PREDICTED: uncharacterized protein LOC108564751 [Nicrophorus vespilloides]|uniref:Uncharacterized protein LOC108564751 n=1 Tax=Nicrophorus vespilloides TaxID=110193 RepID=A0ABM1MXQ3_NICVS|nr:PREDICTED: uncharacterized protein LOC108564751 [Nicrophorus vespilloides]